ncbi:M56 family metallopeptidase [Romeria aff. gracilis LEGE 07310]|uniref:M56 family metallopeptidase n=1 Tax=Vasconcelosia minhoensis LEGE 07310 TaxID=915328 RepID=A0A8J7DBP5_9CYAN|nr:M56 family metallopeptidase [Romeria gracilis]MBE9078022.1 M56 family metallopeptidase [Romeria aff. gracilis LEGE 07310]
MHGFLLLLSTAIAVGLRLTMRADLTKAGPGRLFPRRPSSDLAWETRWRRTLASFALPPLLILATALAVLAMGLRGYMLGLPVGWLGYSVALGLIGMALGVLAWLAGLGMRSRQQICALPPVIIQNQPGRQLDSAVPFAARVGFWQPELIVSRGLTAVLTPSEVEAVLLHEQAHRRYRDPFWFFWLGWLGRISAWLPATQQLWQELLLLRELRADRWAARRVEPLILAESLLKMTQFAVPEPNGWVLFASQRQVSRLEERINVLLDSPSLVQNSGYSWLWLGLGSLILCLPLLTMLLHTAG